MKKALLIVAAAGVAVFVQQKLKSDQASKDLWAQASDQPRSH
ncbi:DLW-39 family protein [Leekyejoonella antrihumi]|nr:DLW-39 family protein [Leekyejoonella antrihumi]